MKANSLPIKFSTLYRIIRFLKNRPVSINIDAHEQTNSKHLLNMKIDSIEFCSNEKINYLFKNLAPFSEFVQIFLHGSWADDTKTPFSDIDDFVVLDLESLQDEKSLYKVMRILNSIDMRFCRLDPIQHHGHWICSKNELLNYNNSFLPLHILKDSKSVIGKNGIEGVINIQQSKEGIKRNIINTCNGITSLAHLYFNGTINAYNLKCLVGSFVLMPAFIMQLLGEDCTKREAIFRSENVFSGNSHLCIQWSSNCRNNWDVITTSKKFKSFALFPYLFWDPHVWRRFSSTFSPKVTTSQKKQLSSIILTEEIVNEFVSNSLKYAK